MTPLGKHVRATLGRRATVGRAQVVQAVRGSAVATGVQILQEIAAARAKGG